MFMNSLLHYCHLRSSCYICVCARACLSTHPPPPAPQKTLCSSSDSVLQILNCKRQKAVYLKDTDNCDGANDEDDFPFALHCKTQNGKQPAWLYFQFQNCGPVA